MAGAWRRHDRRWKQNRYVYAVISRRSRGVSVGINLNPGGECNFDCVYCQVDRSMPMKTLKVDLEMLSAELDRILEAEKNGSLYAEDPFAVLSPEERGIRDIAFSGDGEPTAFPRFEEAVRIAVESRRRFALRSTRLVLITNAANLARPRVRAALTLLDQNSGEIWAKLDAGTEEYFRRVNRAGVTLAQLLAAILDAAKVRPVVIQSLWFRIDGVVPPPEEIDAYCDRLNALIASGGQIRNLQLYTIARAPADAGATPLSTDALNRIAAVVKTRVPVPVEIYY